MDAVVGGWGPVAPRHVGSSGTRDGTYVSCIVSPPLSHQGSPSSAF